MQFFLNSLKKISQISTLRFAQILLLLAMSSSLVGYTSALALEDDLLATVDTSKLKQNEYVPLNPLDSLRMKGIEELEELTHSKKLRLVGHSSFTQGTLKSMDLPLEEARMIRITLRDLEDQNDFKTSFQKDVPDWASEYLETHQPVNMPAKEYLYFEGEVDYCLYSQVATWGCGTKVAGLLFEKF